MREITIKISVLLFALFFSVFALANNTSDYNDLVKNAANQINYLEEYNSTQEHSKQWFIYFLGEDLSFLEGVLFDKKGTKQNFSTSFLEKVNEQLITINDNKDAVIYVAVTDIGTSIVLPLSPEGSTIQEKIDFIKDEINNPSRINDINELITGKKQYEVYKKTFEKLGQDIYDTSAVKESNSKHKILPFFAFHSININSGKSEKSKLYLSNTIHIGGEKIDKALLNATKKVALSYGDTWYEKSISKTIDRFNRYFNDEPILIQLEGVKVTTNKDSDLYKASYENRYAPDNAFTPSAKILDFAGISNKDDKDNLAEQLGETQLLSGMQMYVVFTDDDTKNDIITRLQTLEPTAKQYYIWIHIAKDQTTTINHIVPNNFKEQLRMATQHWTAAVWDNIELNSSKANKELLFTCIVAQNHMISLLSGLMKKAIIPQEYWNVNDPNYIKEMQYIAQAMTISSGTMNNVFNAYEAQMTFAFKTGVWNGLIEEVKGLVDLGELVTSYIIDQNKAREFDQAMSQINFEAIWSSVEQAHGFEEGKPLQEFQLAHQLGKDVIIVGSCFIGIGEIVAVAKGAKIASVLGKLTLPTLKFVKKLPNITKKIARLPKNINRNLINGYLVLTVNSRKLAKISDQAVFKEMKLLDASAIVKFEGGENAVFKNVKYVDNSEIEKTGDITFVRQGDDVGVKVSNVGGLENLIKTFKGNIPNFYNSLTKAGYKAEKSGNIIKVYAKNGTDLLAEISESSVRIKYKGWGNDIITKSDRTTTCIAKYYDELDAPGSQFIKKELPEGAFGRGSSNKGGINILDVDKFTYENLKSEAKKILKSSGKTFTNDDVIREANEIFWNRYNLPFLEEAFKRGDDIRLLSDPTTLFGSTGFYQREIEVITKG